MAFFKWHRLVWKQTEHDCPLMGVGGIQDACSGQIQQVGGTPTHLPVSSPGCQRLLSAAKELGHPQLAVRHGGAHLLSLSPTSLSAAVRQWRYPCLTFPSGLPGAMPTCEGQGGLWVSSHTPTQGSLPTGENSPREPNWASEHGQTSLCLPPPIIVNYCADLALGALGNWASWELSWSSWA